MNNDVPMVQTSIPLNVGNILTRMASLMIEEIFTIVHPAMPILNPTNIEASHSKFQLYN